MLPRNSDNKTKSSLKKHKIDDSLHYDEQHELGGDYEHQHLYITSDDEIKKGDYIIHKDHKNKIIKAKSVLDNKWIDWYKIIATTDKSLLLNFEGYEKYTGRKYSAKVYLPQPSKAFIEKYCKVGGIDEVMVEYQEFYYKRWEADDGYKGEWKRITFESYNYSITNPESLHHKWKGYKKEVKLKVNSHNEITIHPIKDSWSREEVENLIYSAMKDKGYTTVAKWQEWIKNNL